MATPSSSGPAWQVVDTPVAPDSRQTRKLYFNPETGVSTFEKPDELKTKQELHRDKSLAEGGDVSLMSFEDMDEEDRAGREGRRLLRRNETYGYIDTNSFSAASLDKPIGEENRGYRLLTKMGWKKGQGLGLGGRGITAPVQLKSGLGNLGLGKEEQDDRYTDEAAKERRKLEVEVEETEEIKVKRLEKAAREQAIKADVQEMNKEFYCQDCDKQYKTVGEMANHLSSYDHHHVKRLRDMQEAERARRGSSFNRDKAHRKEMEEMQRRVAAAAAATSGQRAGGASQPGAKPTAKSLALPPVVANPARPGNANGAGTTPDEATGAAAPPPQGARTAVKFGFGTKKKGAGGFRRR